MFEVLNYTAANPREYTYLGIGSKNRTNDLAKFTADLDQILPCFLNDVKKTIRAIHFDPEFSRDYNFLNSYFKAKGFMNDGNIWISKDFRIEVIICPRMFDLEDNFIHSLVTQTIQQKGQLVVQMFTGHELSNTFRKLYGQFEGRDKEYIRQNVLFDITYGANCHCMTNMAENAPMLDKNGKFINFLLFNEVEILQSIGIHPKMNKLIENQVMKNLSTVLNEDHVNYRRAIRGEELMFLNKPYGTNPEDIMNSLLTSVREILNILNKLGSLTEEKKALFETYSRNYREMDMYKWYADMTKLYK
uniref:Uncharacterized protein n=1 Tax=viral metagenome TaxID=1070528 RepID=A0A6C0B2G2_9ZZZZ